MKLAELLKEMGFSYCKINNRKYYYEQPQIIEQRDKYLRNMMQNRVDKKLAVLMRCGPIPMMGKIWPGLKTIW